MSSINKMKYCPFCGTEIIENAKFCMECGSQLPILNFNNEEEDSTGDNNNKTEVIDPEINNKIVKEKPESNNEIDNGNSTQSLDEKPRKNFNLLKKQKSNINSRNEMETNNIEIRRPTSKINNQNVQQPKNSMGKNNLINTNENIQYSSVKCPSCNKHMQLTEKSGIISGGKYLSCINCNLTFKEYNNTYTLFEEPENSRLHHKLHLKRYSLDDWKKFINGQYSDEEIKEIQNLRYDLMMNKYCPVCDNQLVRYKSGGFRSNTYLVCSVCSTVLKEEGNYFTLYNTADNFSPLWNYVNNPLKLAQMRKIILNEESPESKHKREQIIKNNKIKLREEKNKIIQKEIDISSFMETFKSGNASLSVSSTDVMLKKNEKPVYAIYNVTLREPRAVRKSTGGYGGASIRIAKGVTIHTGKTGSTSQSHDEIKNIDNGKLLITNKRLIFLGSNRTTNIDINKIVAITSTKDMIQIQRSNKQKPEYFNNIKRKQNITVEGRSYNVEIDGNMIKELIMGLTSQ